MTTTTPKGTTMKYQVVQIDDTTAPHLNYGDYRGLAVIDEAGAMLRPVASIDEAHSWIAGQVGGADVTIVDGGDDEWYSHTWDVTITTSARRVRAIIDQLNAYQGYDIWGVVILRLDDYDEARTAQLDTGKNDRFALTNGTVIRWSLGSYGGSAHSPHVPGWYVES